MNLEYLLDYAASNPAFEDSTTVSKKHLARTLQRKPKAEKGIRLPLSKTCLLGSVDDQSPAEAAAAVGTNE